MRVLVVTNLAPLKTNPNAGIFVVRRLQHYSVHGVNFDAVSLGFENSKTVLLLKRFLRRSTTGNPLEEHEGVKFKPVLIPRNLGIVLMNKVSRNYFVKIAERCAERIERSFKIVEYDLIHAHGMYDVPAGLIAKILADKYRKPFIVTAHGSDVNILMPRRREIYVDVLESASATIFVSNALLERAKSLGFSGRNAVVIPNGYDETIFKPMDKEMVRKELGIYKEGYKYVGFVGNLIPIKRADKLGEIFNLIAKEIPETFFIVVGDGSLRQRIEKETKGLNIIFTGRLPQTEVAKYMNAMDVMVLPSRNEGWPCVVLEAQACGTCVVGSNNGGIPEAIGFSEYVVEEGDDFEERFAKRVVEVLKEGYDVNEHLERAKAFTWRGVTEKEIHLYKRLIGLC
ncbi:glycosyltransferase family 4 protein [Thermotoga caldifontis]|uniref:glycosyltransferase family 4 protein n=1 Tax=Thermotoga caldifontis TaxID=1508419 RepID=UPI0005970B79|nr:glycosyltransferase family 4 protein [Thermotoga caldifontis]